MSAQMKIKGISEVFTQMSAQMKMQGISEIIEFHLWKETNKQTNRHDSNSIV